MKQWPDDNQPANFTDLTDEVVAAIRFAYRCTRRNENKDIPVAGPDVPESAVTLRGSYKLTAKQLAISKNDQGRSALEEIVGFAIGLGIEQGRRITLNSHEFTMLKMKAEVANQKTGK